MGMLQDKKALITGGTSGIGLAIARRFLQEGAAVVITGRDEQLGLASAGDLSKLGKAAFVRADAADAAQVEESVASAVEILGGLDCLVNNAGVGVIAGALETTLDEFDFTMDINLRGAFWYARTCFPHLEATGGNMIHISSDAGVQGEADYGIYAVSKAALIMLSNMLAIEGGRRGVRSNTLCPGDVLPGMRHLLEKDGTETADDDPSEWYVPPVGRVGTAEDVAPAAAFLASDQAAFINGVSLLVDGGMRAGMRAGSEPTG